VWAVSGAVNQQTARACHLRNVIHIGPRDIIGEKSICTKVCPAAPTAIVMRNILLPGSTCRPKNIVYYKDREAATVLR